MLRIAFLILGNEFRRLGQDHAALFMLFLAPVVIIAVAGLSLGNLFGAPGTQRYLIAVVDEDHGPVAAALIKALGEQPSVQVRLMPTVDAARRFILHADRAPLAVVIPPGTGARLRAGETVLVNLYIDPVKRLEASQIELRLNELSLQATAAARLAAQREFDRRAADLNERLEVLAGKVTAIQAQARDYQRQLEQARSRLRSTLAAQAAESRREIDSLRMRIQDDLDQAVAQARAQLKTEMAAKRAGLALVSDYLHKLQLSKNQFDQWIEQLRTLAGSYANRIPPPPQWPPPPSQAQLNDLARPVELAFRPPLIPQIDFSRHFALPDLQLPAMPHISIDTGELAPASLPAIPGEMGWQDRSLTRGRTRVNSFDQYVPGFGITFLLLDMLWGVSVGLIDERDWGTLQRLRASGAPVSGLMLGKLLAHFCMGLIQMTVLFSVGWLIFGITLGDQPAALLVPCAAISFAGAAFGLIIACLARTRDAVLPIGSVAAMAMSAIGGCWWPISFEPAWMRTLALWLPTTWTMRAFNDLMIRRLEPSSIVVPVAVTAGLGLLYLAVGLLGSLPFYE
jgi:ABC-type multidrug transport system permease subunit